MDGFKAFKYHTALKLHFTSPSFDVFQNKGRIRGSLDKFMSRNDKNLYEKVARKYPVDKECILFFASNFMYGHSDIVYDLDQSVINYQEFQRRRQAITRMFHDDVDRLINDGIRIGSDPRHATQVLQYFLGNKIKLETLVILDIYEGIIDSIRRDGHLSLLLGDELLRIEKSRKFVKFDSHKVMSVYQNLLKGEENSYGQDVSSTANIL